MRIVKLTHKEIGDKVRADYSHCHKTMAYPDIYTFAAYDLVDNMYPDNQVMMQTRECEAYISDVVAFIVT